jgi:addiction module HigA family antidote
LVLRAALSRIWHGRSPDMADMAIRFTELLGTSPQLWLGMQTAYDLWVAQLNPRSKVLPLASR